jgi:hypothetical protein
VRDVLPGPVVEHIGSQYREAVRTAAAQYDQYRADEDSVTGALGGVFDVVARGELVTDDEAFSWSTRVWKVRGRGPEPPESRYGIDGLFEIEVKAGARTTARKLLPFQAKKDRGYDDDKLLEQAATVARLPGGGAVVSFAPRSYTVAPADVVASAQGNWASVADERKQDLGDMLADDFIECRLGSRGLYYDPFTETFLFPGADGQLVEVPGFVRERVKTTVKRRARVKRTGDRGGRPSLSEATEAAELIELARRRAKVLV